MGGQRETFFQDQVPEHPRERTASVSVLVLHLSIFLSTPAAPRCRCPFSLALFLSCTLFFSHSGISPLFHLHAQCEDHSSAKKRKHRRCCRWRRRALNTSPTQHHDSLQLHKCVFFPIRSTLPELSLPLRSQCVHSWTSCSKQNTCQRIPAMGARVYVHNSSS